MSDLTEYTVTVNGVEHQMMLNEEDAKRYGVSKKSADSGETPGAVKASGAQSKVHTTQNK